MGRYTRAEPSNPLPQRRPHTLPYLRLTSGVCGSLLALFRHVELPTDELDLKTSLIPPPHKHKAPFLHFPRCSRPPGFIHILFLCAITKPHNDGVLNSASGPPSCCLPWAPQAQVFPSQAPSSVPWCLRHKVGLCDSSLSSFSPSSFLSLYLILSPPSFSLLLHSLLEQFSFKAMKWNWVQ